MFCTGDTQGRTHSVLDASERLTMLVLFPILLPQAVDVLVPRLVVAAAGYRMDQGSLLLGGRRADWRHNLANHAVPFVAVFQQSPALRPLSLGNQPSGGGDITQVGGLRPLPFMVPTKVPA